MGSYIGIKIDPDGIHIMKKSESTPANLAITAPTAPNTTRSATPDTSPVRRRRRKTSMKLRSLAVPYVGWMALFVATPVVIILVYAVTNSDGG